VTTPTFAPTTVQANVLAPFLMPSLRNLLRPIQPEKMIPIYFQNIIQNLMLFPNVKRSTVIYHLAIFGLKIPSFG